MEKAEKDNCEKKIEKKCRKKIKKIFNDKYKKKIGLKIHKSLSNTALCVFVFIVVVVVILIGGWFLFKNYSIVRQSEQIVEYSSRGYSFPNYLDYMEFYRNKFPYKHVCKSNSGEFITFVICSCFVLSVALVCVTLLATTANNYELARKKLCAVKLCYSELAISAGEKESKISEKTAGKKYYPKNKALVDNFKAYANAIAEL